MSFEYKATYEGLEIVVCHDLPRRHIGDHLVFIRDHPAWAFIQRRLLRRKNYCGGFFVQGAPLYQTDAVQIGGRFYCTPEQYQRMLLDYYRSGC